MTIVIFILVLAILILVHEFGHFIVAKKSGIRVDEFGLGFPPRLFKIKPKGSDTTYSINLILAGGFVKIFGENPDEDSTSGPDSARSFINKPKSTQALVLAAGIVFNIIFAWLIFSIGFMSGMPYASEGRYEDRVGNKSIVITSVLDKSPAEVAGLIPGDNIISINGSEEELSVNSIQSSIASSEGSEVPFLIQRGDDVVELTVNPETGVIGDMYAIGIKMTKVGILKLPPHLAIWEGLRLSGEMMVDITVGFSTLVYNAIRGTANFSGLAGPVGIAGLIGDASVLGFIHLMLFTAFISLNLAVLNLIPFPALDGGRLLFVLIEKLKGSPINHKIANSFNTVGFLLLLALLVAVTYNDIARLF